MRGVQSGSGVSSAAVLRDPNIGRSGGLRVASVWTVACLVILLWWASVYRSLIETLAEWQFALLGRYYPSLTVIVIALLLALPIAGAVGLLRRRRRRQLDGGKSRVEPLVAMTRAIGSAERGRIFFLSVAAVMAVVAGGVFLSMLWLPSSGGPVRIIAGIDGSVQPQGPAAYARPFRLGQVARIEENVGLVRRVMYIAPVYLRGQRSSTSFLTTVNPADTRPIHFIPIGSGVLVEQGLPRELSNLYRIVDIVIPDRSYLLVRDAATLRWRPTVLGVQIALLSLVTLVVGLLFGRQIRRLRSVIDQSHNTSQSMLA